jgi:predicted CopG family antitoxin
MENQETTIQVNKKVKRELDGLKLHPRESYNDVIERLIVVETEDEELSPETVKHIEQSLKEIKAGKYASFEQVKRRAGLK